jgi:hypothetical protein
MCEAMRSRSTPAMLCQFEAEETLVPPNFKTTQGANFSNTGFPGMWRLRRASSGALKSFDSIVFENVAQLFFQLALGKNVLDAAPSRLAPLAYGGRFRPALCPVYERIEVMRFFGFAKKLIVDVEMFVVAFAHCSRKALEINRIDQPTA